MSTLKGQIVGKEMLIMLPVTPEIFTLTTDPPGEVQLQSGIHAVVASGLIGVNDKGSGLEPLLTITDDDDVATWELHAEVGPFWRSISQVSAMVSMGGIASRDSDEVDHSLWAVAECTWDEVPAGSEPGKRIRLKVKLQVQGFGNGWVTLAYQVVATGNLMRLPKPSEISGNLD
jgi:hypothetical protein